MPHGPASNVPSTPGQSSRQAPVSDAGQIPSGSPEPARIQSRLIRQQLESLRRAGLTHLPFTNSFRDRARQASLPCTPTPAGDAMTPQAQSQRVAKSAETAAAGPSTSKPPDSQGTFKAPTMSDRQMPLTTAGRSADELPLVDRQQALCGLADQVAACQRCQELAAKRTQTVFGVGDAQARLMFIGEAPGADEDRQGEPFVGAAGKLMDKIIAACRMRREEIYICNILKCRPPGNRNPTLEESKNCREYLDGQIAVVDPEYIVCWGSVAAQNLLDTKTPIGKLRGRFRSCGRAKVLCTYHPSYLLRNPSAKMLVWDDMKLLLGDMGVDWESD